MKDEKFNTILYAGCIYTAGIIFIGKISISALPVALLLSIVVAMYFVVREGLSLALLNHSRLENETISKLNNCKDLVDLQLQGFQIPKKFKKMNKSELIDSMANGANLSKADAKRALDAFLDSTGGALKKGDKVALVGFGTFSVSKRAARKGRNPQTGKEINIAAKNVVKFKAGSELSSKVK